MSNYEKVQALFKTLNSDTKHYLQQYFKCAPDWLYDSLQVVTYKSNHTFIEQGEKVQSVHILVKGIVKGTDYPILGAMYDFMWFDPVKTFGALEYFADIDTFNATLVTASPCTMITLPLAAYIKWIEQDINAMRIDASTTTNQLLYEIRRERIYIFVQGTDRLTYFLLLYYKQFAIQGACQINLTRQELSDSTGLSIRTVNRGITALLEQGCLLKSGSQLVIKKQQYERLQELLDALF